MRLTNFDRSRAVELALVFLLLLLETTLLQRLSGAWRAELGGYPDEAAHFVTGLMARDFLASGSWAHPLRFAQDYYAHYPKVAIGHWPPAFYAVEGVWLLLFGASRIAALLLMATVSAVAGTALYAAARSAGRPAALLVALLLPAVPLVVWLTSMVMPEMLVALLAFLAMLSFARYLETQKTAEAMRFAVLVSLAVLTKGNGFALFLLPPIAIAISARWRTALRPSLWGAAAVAAVLCAPWYLLTLRVVVPTWTGRPGLDYTRSAAAVFTPALAGAAGPIVFALAVTGVAGGVILGTERRIAPLRASAAALVLGVWLFHLIVWTGLEPRFMAPAIAPLLLLAAFGARDLALLLPRTGTAAAAGAVVAVGVVAFALTCFSLPTKLHFGLDDAAALIARDPRARTVLISSQRDGEGILISEIAIRDERPGRTVVRATKLLTQTDWLGADPVDIYETADEVSRVLDQRRIDAVVIDHAPGIFSFRHHGLLQHVMRQHPETWTLAAIYKGGDVEVWRRR